MIEFENTLLYEYRNVIDANFIVSKTNLDGRIIYVNDKFCEISGFTYEELIGKPHNIVRHPSMPSEVFAQMWNDIQHKKTWRGRITNLKKSGESYIVETVVSPIVDHYGHINEYIAIRYDVTEFVETGHKLHEEEIKRKEQEMQNETLQKINAAKDSFLLIFTHELKTPLNAVITFSDYINSELKNKGKEFEELVELAGTIRQSGLAMLQTVESLLELGKLKAHKLGFICENTAIATLVQKSLSQNTVLLTTNGIKVEKRIASEKLLKTDPNQFSKIVGNLLSNAIKYARSTIIISFKQGDSSFEFSVDDDGPGVLKENRLKIFELFEQAEDSHLNRKAKGTGIGLHFVKLLCDEMGYTVECQQSATLRGASFQIKGPLYPKFK